MAAHRSRSTQLFAALLITLVAMALAPLTSVAATTAVGGVIGVGSISGTVVDGNGDPLENVSVDATAEDFSTYGNSMTDTDGTYTITDLPAGHYQVSFLLDAFYECYDNDPYCGSPTLVEVTDGADTPAIDAMLGAAGSISGRVVDESGDPVPGIDVDVQGDATFTYESAATAADGTYTVANLEDDDYMVEFRPPDGSFFVGEYYDNTQDYGEATLVEVAGGADVANIDAELAEGGSLSGTVTGPGGTALQDVGVYVSDDFDHFGYGYTAADGTYTVTGLAAGSGYRVEFNPPFGSDLVAEYFNNQPTFSGADLVTVNSGADTPDIDAQLEVGGSISGTLTDNLATPVAGATIYASGPDGMGFATTNPDGTYEVKGLHTGDYRVNFIPGTGSGLVGEYYDGWYNYQNADMVSVTVGAATTDIDAQLALGGTVTGTVTAPGGAGLENVYVQLSGPGLPTVGDFTGPDGTYSIHGAVPSTFYTVRFNPAYQSPYLGEWFDNVATQADAQFLTVGAGTTITDIDAELALGGSLSGTVTGPGGTPVGNVTVSAGGKSAPTASNGTYSVVGLPAGPTTVRFQAPVASGLVSEYFNDAATINDATPVAITLGSNTPGIDAALIAGGSISGTVTVADGGAPVFATVTGYSNTHGSFSTSTGVDGTYTLGGLPADDYAVEFVPGFSANDGLLTEYYNNVKDFEAATPVTVGAGSAVPGINAALDQGGRIAGTVTAPGGAPLAGAYVSATIVGSYPDGYAVTGADGTYEIVGLQAEDYVVSFFAAGYASQYYDDVVNEDDATPVLVSLGATTPGIDAELHAGGSISGTVTKAGGAPVEGVVVSAARQHGMPVTPRSSYEEATTAADGTYTITGLDAGDYSLYFGAPSGSGLAGEYYDDATQFTDATLIAVGAGAVTGKNATLAETGTITGQVTTTGAVGVPGVNVTVYEDGVVVGFGTTEPTGNYRVADLPPGTYKVGFEPPTLLELGFEYYNDKGSLSTADTVTVTGGTNTPGINALLTGSGSISGTITDPEGDPLSASVKVFATDGTAVATGSSNGSGEYVVGGLRAGTYKVQFIPYFLDPYEPEYYDDAATFAAANLVTVTSGATTPDIDGQLALESTLTAPTKPINATASAGNAQATVDWDAPAFDGGSPITGYTVTASPGGATVNVGGGVTVATVTGLTNGTSYTFTVTATNAIDTSPPSDPTNSVTPTAGTTAPSKPLNATASSGNAQATVDWDPPASTGGSPITGYTVTASPGGATENVGGATTVATVTGLTNGTSYTFTVKATNATGTSPPSDPSNAVVPSAGGTTECDGLPVTVRALFTDVGPTHPFCEDIEWLVEEGVTTGFPDGSFRPGGSVTRMAMAAFIYRYAGEPAFTPPATPTFSDVPTSHPFFKEIEWMVDAEITGGFPDGTFRPGGSITRQAMAAFMYRMAGEPAFTPPATRTFPDVPTTHPFYDEIEWMADSGVTGGFPDGSFRPGGTVTRQAMAAFLHRFDDAFGGIVV